MNHELISLLLGSTAVGAAASTILSKAGDWLAGRAKDKRDMEAETARALEAERARAFDCAQALYEALRELVRLEADTALIDRLKRVAAGNDPHTRK
ncbi:MAG: hypothetical protein Q4D87_09040 [Actinomycetaceae bacterium]|nr:hypothetical protein [Actinomycetaceae bacterium]